MMANASRKKKGGGDSKGEGQKVKRVRTAPTNTSLLPPCKVCGEPAAGFHYGANTCEACKGFFRRTIVRGRGYQCVNGDEKCEVIQAGKKEEKNKICPQCRHLKCLAVGMSTGAIKTGRYTHAKRTQDILEYKQVMGARDSPRGSPSPSPSLGHQPSDSSPPPPPTAAVISPAPPPLPPITAIVPSSVTLTSTVPSLTTSVTAAAASLTLPSTTATTMILSSQSAASFAASISSATASFSALGVLPSYPDAEAAQPSPMTRASSFSGVSSPSRVISPNWNNPSFRVLSATFSPESFEGFEASPESMGRSLAAEKGGPPFAGCEATLEAMQSADVVRATLDEDGFGEDTDSRELCALTPVSLLSSDQGVLTPASSSSLSSPGGTTLSGWGEGGGGGGGGGGGVKGDLSDEECRQLTQQLLTSHSCVHSCKYSLTPQQRLEKQRICFEKCEAQMEAFGSLGHVSEEEYQEIYRATGIDVDDRQFFLSQFAQLLDANIRQHIAFVKTIPGFSSLSVKDQIRLIKNSRCEVSLIFQSEGFNEDLLVMCMPSGGTFCHHQIEKLVGHDRMQNRFRALREVKKLGLSVTEKVLVKCLMLFTLGQDDVEDPDTVCDIQWRMAQCLMWVMKENGRPQPPIFFSRIISAMCLIKELTKVHYDWVKKEPFSHYACFKNNKLLAEWFSSS